MGRLGNLQISKLSINLPTNSDAAAAQFCVHHATRKARRDDPVGAQHLPNTRGTNVRRKHTGKPSKEINLNPGIIRDAGTPSPL